MTDDPDTPDHSLSRMERATIVCREIIELAIEGHELKHHGPERICRNLMQEAVAEIAHGLDLTPGDMDVVGNKMAQIEEHCAHEPTAEDDDDDEDPDEDRL